MAQCLNRKLGFLLAHQSGCRCHGQQSLRKDSALEVADNGIDYTGAVAGARRSLDSGGNE